MKATRAPIAALLFAATCAHAQLPITISDATAIAKLGTPCNAAGLSLRITGVTNPYDIVCDGTWKRAGSVGNGDVSTATGTSVDGEIALFDGTTGKALKRAATTGVIKATSGVLSAASAGVDYAPATTGSGILKGDSAGGTAAAVPGTDYSAPGTSETASGDRTFTGAVDASGATSTKPFQSGTTLPATCSVRQVFFKTDAPAGSNIYLCTSTNTWSAISSAAFNVASQSEAEAGTNNANGMTPLRVSQAIAALSAVKGMNCTSGISCPQVNGQFTITPNTALLPTLLGNNIWTGHQSLPASATQDLVNATDMLICNRRTISVNPTSNLTLTGPVFNDASGTPADGAECVAENISTNSLTIRDLRSYPGSGVYIPGGGTVTIPAKSRVRFAYSTGLGARVLEGTPSSAGTGFPETNGMVAKTDDGAVSRTLQAGQNVTITNPDGVDGDPTISVPGVMQTIACAVPTGPNVTTQSITDVEQVAVPMTGLAVGGLITLKARYTGVGVAGTKSVRYELDGTNLGDAFNSGSLTTVGGLIVAEVALTGATERIMSATHWQSGGNTASSGMAAANGRSTVSTGNATGNLTLKLYARVGNAADSWTLKHYCVYYTPPQP